jgi:hypothetical protein
MSTPWVYPENENLSEGQIIDRYVAWSGFKNIEAWATAQGYEEGLDGGLEGFWFDDEGDHVDLDYAAWEALENEEAK